jgi:hypothetical protein
MDIKSYRAEVKDVSNATVLMKSGDRLSVGYTDTNGKFHTFNIAAQNLVFLVSHQESEAAMLIRPSVGIQYIEPDRK